jgi:hypothetical protein
LVDDPAQNLNTAEVLAYLVLSLFDHAARADEGPVGATDPVVSVTGVGKALPRRLIPI